MSSVTKLTLADASKRKLPAAIAQPRHQLINIFWPHKVKSCENMRNIRSFIPCSTAETTPSIVDDIALILERIKLCLFFVL